MYEIYWWALLGELSWNMILEFAVALCCVSRY